MEPGHRKTIPDPPVSALQPHRHHYNLHSIHNGLNFFTQVIETSSQILNYMYMDINDPRPIGHCIIIIIIMPLAWPQMIANND